MLESLDGRRLRALACLFGGGTAIALRYGEYRESVDIDFLVSEPDGYRRLRQSLTGPAGLGALQRDDASPLRLARDIRADQYGIRTALLVEGQRIKFEIVREARIALDAPGRSDVVCGVPTLSPTDMAASKLLANSDRWRDDSAFSRDAIDLAMMDLPPRRLRPAIDKASTAYGDGVVLDMQRALDRLRTHPDHLQRCMRAMAMTLPPAALQQRLRSLRRRLDRATGRD
ncbi:nucleotidyl transferase AbiEii/AbiGii toxin family protein [Luteimonas huabeiensis]|uniref:nucleotidyl transferase AbiEii/AbiGii toxin family protein n=1 Tax=Luteimonas huabeiensis TaxID=1244513 RepID=UPI001F36CF66|nr:nucleotidyl transferase AbiEii/AbiGii toxin family protein [Luteimonas huabeiensis]